MWSNYYFKELENLQEWLGVRTDLAIEAKEMITNRITHPVIGVNVVTSKDEDVLITRVKIENESAAKSLGKAPGLYVTIEAEGLRYNNKILQSKIMDLFAQELADMAKLKKDSTILVVGLGNRNITPDALGPKVTEKLVVTRHLRSMISEELRGGVRSVCAIEPGVLGITGMETAEIIQGIVDKIRPDLVIAVDALAAASSKRMNTTIQLADTGIHPGSGVDNKRFGLNKQSLGVPVIAVGIPTVIHASNIAADTVQLLKDHAAFSRYFKSLESLSDQEQKLIIREILPESLGNLMVTPKEIDRLMDDLSQVVAGGLNQALHPDIDYENIHLYLQ